MIYSPLNYIHEKDYIGMLCSDHPMGLRGK